GGFVSTRQHDFPHPVARTTYDPVGPSRKGSASRKPCAWCHRALQAIAGRRDRLHAPAVRIRAEALSASGGACLASGGVRGFPGGKPHRRRGGRMKSATSGKGIGASL